MLLIKSYNVQILIKSNKITTNNYKQIAIKNEKMENKISTFEVSIT